MKIHIGIDPGINGGIAFIPTIGDPWAEKMPETDQDIIECLRDSIPDNNAHAMLELVHSSPQMGVKSAFTFGEGYGLLQMALTSLADKMNKQEWRGYPLRCWPNHQDDCYRWDWEILIDGKWVEVVTQATRWIEEEAEEALQRYLKSKKA